MKVLNSQRLLFNVFKSGRKQWVIIDQPRTSRRGGPSDIFPDGYKRWNQGEYARGAL